VRRHCRQAALFFDYRAGVFTPDVRFEGFTAEDWQRFLHLWKPRAPAEREPGRPRGGLFVIHDGARLRKILHTERGRVERERTWPVPLTELAFAHHAAWVISAHEGALDELMDRFGARARRGDDFIAQALTLVSIVHDMLGEGAIDNWPRRLRGVPPPTDAMVRKALDAVCPEGRAILLGMFEMGELWTAFVARRRGGAFDLIAGPDELRPAMGLLSGDWRRDYLHLARVVEERYAPLGLGCFAEVEVFRSLQVDPRPGAWGRAVILRDIVLSPMPAAVGLALSVDGAKYAFDSLKTLTRRVHPLGFLDPALRGIRARLGAAAGDKDVGRVLGFDPIAVLRALLRR
jgi:hypothetical protein